MQLAQRRDLRLRRAGRGGGGARRSGSRRRRRRENEPVSPRLYGSNAQRQLQRLRLLQQRQTRPLVEMPSPNVIQLGEHGVHAGKDRLLPIPHRSPGGRRSGSQNRRPGHPKIRRIERLLPRGVLGPRPHHAVRGIRRLRRGEGGERGDGREILRERDEVRCHEPKLHRRLGRWVRLRGVAGGARDCGRCRRGRGRGGGRT
mmetsp:Transcript_12464/g.26322  ORF Transcript_12464/g.26322 Transcript_12464/m.26322 type:complete len:201 (-) Transcript_12464:2044-2646(-)